MGNAQELSAGQYDVTKAVGYGPRLKRFFILERIAAPGLEFVTEEFQEVQLLCGRRLGSAVFVTLRVYGHIFQETVKDIHCFDVFIDAYTV